MKLKSNIITRFPSTSLSHVMLFIDTSHRVNGSGVLNHLSQERVFHGGTIYNIFKYLVLSLCSSPFRCYFLRFSR